MADALPPRQQRFVDEYLIDQNATQAAIRAGYAKKTAEHQASRLLGNVGIKAAIKAGMARLSAKAEMTASEVVREIARLADTDIRDYLEWDAKGIRLKPSKKLAEAAARAIAEVSQTAHGIRLKLHSKTHALELLGRRLGLFNDKLSLSGDLDLTHLDLTHAVLSDEDREAAIQAYLAAGRDRPSPPPPSPN